MNFGKPSRWGVLGDLLLPTLALVCFCSEDIGVATQEQASEEFLRVPWSEQFSEGSTAAFKRGMFRVARMRVRFAGLRGKHMQNANLTVQEQFREQFGPTIATVKKAQS